MKGKKAAFIIFMLCLFIASCGYRFAGGGRFPGGINSVSVAIFENRTSETGLENTISNDIIYEITRNRRIALANPDKADAVLSGVINMDIKTITHKGQSSQERRVLLWVDLKLTEPSGNVLWEAKDVSADETYDEMAIRQATEQERTEALSLLSKRLAEYVYNRLSDDF